MMTSEGILLKRVFGDGQEEILAGWLTATIAFGLICFQNWGLPPGGELGFPVRWDGRSLVSAAAS